MPSITQQVIHEAQAMELLRSMLDDGWHIRVNAVKDGYQVWAVSVANSSETMARANTLADAIITLASMCGYIYSDVKDVQ